MQLACALLMMVPWRSSISIRTLGDLLRAPGTDSALANTKNLMQGESPEWQTVRKGADLELAQVREIESRLDREQVPLSDLCMLVGNYLAKGLGNDRLLREKRAGIIRKIVEDLPILCELGYSIGFNSTERFGDASHGLAVCFLDALSKEPESGQRMLAAAGLLRWREPKAARELLERIPGELRSSPLAKRIADGLPLIGSPSSQRGSAISPSENAEYERALVRLCYGLESGKSIDSVPMSSLSHAAQRFHVARLALRAGHPELAYYAARDGRSIPEAAPGASEHVRKDTVHEACVIMGLARADQGKLQEAGELLIESIRAGDSGSVLSFGPDFSLASRLLEREERQSVYEYLSVLQSKWKDKSQLVGFWMRLVSLGLTPSLKSPR